ncbi:MAG TPA: cold shock domain-containing protein [Gammaproteobacteria bacterium]|nr:cold shock domain-containing protein [Gammaproteobacteria bacterium]HPI96137.1 cold shock domain-containing protein [Gammaproteobacteria bacterium]HPQ86178.1 cold shock domain-containing protein [Gammaproteobacteria bacterium]
MVGTIKWYMEAKGYGLITGDDGREVTVHFSAIQGGGYLREGQTVEYSVVMGPRGEVATNVVPLN